MEKVVYAKQNRKESIPFVGCFGDLAGIYDELKSFCQQKKFLEEKESEGDIPQEKKVDGDTTVNELFKKIFPKEESMKRKEKKYVLLYGKSAMENISSFYNHLLLSITDEWVKDEEDVVVIMFLEYFNSGTAKALIQMLKLISNNFKKRASFVWLSDIDDSDSLESGNEISEIVSFEDVGFEKIFHIEEVIYYFETKRNNL